MCWCLHVYWTVLHNLFARFVTNVVNSVYKSDVCSCLSCCSSLACCFCCENCFEYKQTPDEPNTNGCNESEFVGGERGGVTARALSTFQHHDYVIVDDIDANYLQIECRKIETEQYYRLVDRATAEDILSCREDGSCLVRPFKEADLSIKYIVTIFARKQYFHLFIRQINGKNVYGIGQEKPNEKTFNSPSDIIDFYSCNALQCTNKNISISLLLKPIIS